MQEVAAGPDLDDLLDEDYTEEDGSFFLAGHTHEVFDMDPKLHVYTKCNNTNVRFL